MGVFISPGKVAKVVEILPDWSPHRRSKEQLNPILDSATLCHGFTPIRATFLFPVSSQSWFCLRCDTS